MKARLEDIQTKKRILVHYQNYPKLQIVDIFKFLYQSSFGCEHFVTDLVTVNERILKEAEDCQLREGESTEVLDGDFCRVHLDWIKDGLSIETLGKLFFLSAKPVDNGKELLEEKLGVFIELTKEGILPFSLDEVKAECEKWKSEGYPSCHHSNEFRNNYFPAYRVIRKEFADLLPMLLHIDLMLQKDSVTMAIEGGSAAGKTTLSGILEEVYETTVFHMDDFFLRPEQRRKERFEKPGGNVDWERFLEEVLLPLKNKEPIYYRRFDCSTFTIQPAVVKNASKVNVIEGAYSMHPKLSEYYDFSVFLDITSDLQKKRIIKRNSKEFAERFFNEWIPMEKFYFDSTKAKQRCDIKFSIRDE